MNKTNYIFLLLAIITIILTVAVTAVTITCIFEDSSEYIPWFVIQGDIEQELKCKDLAKLEATEIEYKGQEFKVIKLKDIIKKAGPLTDNYDLILSAADGLRARISGKKLEECYINFSEQNGWEAINLNHPRSSNIKFIRKIIVTANTVETTRTFRIISPGKNLIQKTPGQLLAGSYQYKPVFEGVSTVKHNGRKYSTEIYSEKEVVKPENLLNNDIKKRTLIIGEKGKTLTHRGGMLDLRGNKINYINPDRKVELEKCQGMIIDAPIKSNKNVFYDTLHYLKKGQKVMVIILDGFGFHQYKYCSHNRIIPFMAGINNSFRALTAFRPVTNTGLAAILTGKGPEVNGVYSRDNKNIKVTDIFQKAVKFVEDSYKRTASLRNLDKLLDNNISVKH